MVLIGKLASTEVISFLVTVFILFQLIISPTSFNVLENDELGLVLTNAETTIHSAGIKIAEMQLDSLENAIVASMDRGEVPSLAAALIIDNSIVWTKGFGEQPEQDTVYLIGSITKTFTATALMQLYERGAYDLDDDVNDYLPFDFRNPNYPDVPITFRMILSHTSSIRRSHKNYYMITDHDLLIKLGRDVSSDYYISYPDWFEEYFVPGGSLYTPEVWGDWSPVEERFSYSNPGFDLLGYLVEILSGQSMLDYLNENIFTSLNMINTGYNTTEFKQDQLAIGYNWDTYSNSLVPLPHYDSICYGAGALRSTAEDLSKYLIAHMNGGMGQTGVRILQNETVNTMHGDGTSSKYALGWSRGESQGHSGAIYGFCANMKYKQSSAYEGMLIGAIVLVNLGSSGGYTVQSEVTNLLFDTAENGLELSAPREVTATKANSTVRIDWKAPLDIKINPVLKYYVYRGESINELGLIAVVNQDQFIYYDGKIQLNTAYYYAVCAVNAQGEIKFSDIAGPIIIDNNTGKGEDVSGFAAMNIAGLFILCAVIITRKKTRRP